MQRAATEVMQSIVFSAVLDAIAALKAGSGGLPNQLLRDVQEIFRPVKNIGHTEGLPENN